MRVEKFTPKMIFEMFWKIQKEHITWSEQEVFAEIAKKTNYNIDTARRKFNNYLKDSQQIFTKKERNNIITTLQEYFLEFSKLGKIAANWNDELKKSKITDIELNSLLQFSLAYQKHTENIIKESRRYIIYAARLGEFHWDKIAAELGITRDWATKEHRRFLDNLSELSQEVSPIIHEQKPTD